MSREYFECFECPECGTEIIEADECGECGGTGEVLSKVSEVIIESCPYCNGTGLSHNYHCSHCDWSFEE